MDKQYKLIIFDVDGTLVTTKTGATFRKTADDWQWLPGRLEKLRALKVQGVRLAVATNQGGVAYGFMRREDILVELIKMCKEAGIPAGGLYVCYTHPKGSLEEYRRVDDRRKPGSGMLIEAMADFEAEPDETLYVGDLPDDEQAAKNVGIDFLWAALFFGEEVTKRKDGLESLRKDEIMKKSVEQLKEEQHLLWITLSNCHTALSMANASYLPANVKQFVEMALEEARYALDKTVTKEQEEASDE